MFHQGPWKENYFLEPQSVLDRTESVVARHELFGQCCCVIAPCFNCCRCAIAFTVLGETYRLMIMRLAARSYPTLHRGTNRNTRSKVDVLSWKVRTSEKSRL